jgi:hypothetical protein
MSKIFIRLSVDFLVEEVEDVKIASKYVSLLDKEGKSIVDGELYRIGFENEDGDECDEDGILL